MLIRNVILLRILFVDFLSHSVSFSVVNEREKKMILHIFFSRRVVSYGCKEQFELDFFFFLLNSSLLDLTFSQVCPMERYGSIASTAATSYTTDDYLI